MKNTLKKQILSRTKYLKTLLIFGILTGFTGTVYAQSSTLDSLKCDSLGIFYTDKQDKRCLECLINEPKKDSLISLQEVFAAEQAEEIVLLRKRNEMLKRKRRNAFFIGGGIGIIVTSITALAVGLSK